MIQWSFCKYCCTVENEASTVCWCEWDFLWYFHMLKVKPDMHISDFCMGWGDNLYLWQENRCVWEWLLQHWLPVVCFYLMWGGRCVQGGAVHGVLWYTYMIRVTQLCGYGCCKGTVLVLCDNFCIWHGSSRCVGMGDVMVGLCYFVHQGPNSESMMYVQSGSSLCYCW